MKERREAKANNTVLVTTGTVAASSGTIHLPSPGRADRTGVGKGPSLKVESAVYSYIQAVRALGSTRVNTTDIARALELEPAAVRSAITALKSKGVKRA